jgi:hypothetical protein
VSDAEIWRAIAIAFEVVDGKEPRGSVTATMTLLSRALIELARRELKPIGE